MGRTPNIYCYGATVAASVILVLFTCHLPASNNTQSDEPLGYYSSDYHDARTKFLSAARSSGGQTESFKNSITGPEGEALYLDVAVFGTRSPSVTLVLGSGTHGVEGFVGSAIQTGLLLEGIVSRLGPHTGLVMIHAINPYGFAHLRRANEDNVDLNRNFTDHSRPHPENTGYELLADTIAPLSLTFWSNTTARLRLLWYRLRHGAPALQRAISGGQYTHPKGLFYGGLSDSWSNRTIRKIASRYLSTAKRMVVIDFHTGLGPFGRSEVILNVSKDSPAYKRALKWWGDEVKTTVSGESVSAHLQGTLKLAFPRMLPGVEVTAVSQEFGTLPPLEVFWALRSENWLHHHGGSEHPDSIHIKNNLLRAFYPDDEQWKLRVWQQGSDIVERALAQLETNLRSDQ